MSYIINNSRGNIVAVIPDGTTNTSSTSLSLVGQGVTNYGTAENENWVYLLENFAAPTAPTAYFRATLVQQHHRYAKFLFHWQRMDWFGQYSLCRCTKSKSRVYRDSHSPHRRKWHFNNSNCHHSICAKSIER